jgi:hypothetical protein
MGDMEHQLDLGFGVPTRVVALDRDRGHWENELQVDLGRGWERVMSFAPPREGPKSLPADAAFARAVELAKKNGPRFFEAWAQRRSAQLAQGQALEAERRLRAEQHEKAAPARAAYVEQSLAELGRRSAEKAAEAERRAAATPDDPEFRILAVAFELAEGRTDVEVSKDRLRERCAELRILELSNKDFEAYRQELIAKYRKH